jgi:hypothetical protein
MRPPLPSARALLVVGLVVLTIAACGRRGAPEAPLTAAELAAQQQNPQARQARAQAAAEEDDDATVMVPTPTPTRRRSRRYTIPQEPFILDPLL